MKHPMEEHSVFHIDLIDDLVNNSYADLCEEFPEIADFGDSMCGDLCASCDGDKSCSVCSEISAFLGYDESVPVLADCTTGGGNQFDTLVSNLLFCFLSLQPFVYSLLGQTSQVPSST
ncbi:hypothetical protein AAC387_Pa06g1613 [Persea americana]